MRLKLGFATAFDRFSAHCLLHCSAFGSSGQLDQTGRRKAHRKLHHLSELLAEARSTGWGRRASSFAI